MGAIAHARSRLDPYMYCSAATAQAVPVGMYSSALVTADQALAPTLAMPLGRRTTGLD